MPRYTMRPTWPDKPDDFVFCIDGRDGRALLSSLPFDVAWPLLALDGVRQQLCWRRTDVGGSAGEIPTSGRTLVILNGPGGA